MKAVDKRDPIFQLNEIYKYKNLISSSDKEVIKQIIFKDDTQSVEYHNSFMELVIKEMDHVINKSEFTELKDKLIADMQTHLA